MDICQKPYVRNFEITNICNYNCPICVDKDIEKGNLSIDILEKVLSTNKDIFANKPIWLHYRGEPLINKDIFKIIEIFSKYNVPTMFSTNGLLLTEEVADKLIQSHIYRVVVSVMTLKREKYIEFRGKNNLDKILDNIEMFNKTIISSGSSINLQVMGLDYGQSEKEKVEFVSYFLKKGIDVALHKYSDRAGTSNYKACDVTELEKRYPCEWLFDSMVILYDGSVTTCYYDLCNKNCMGNLKDFDYDIKKLWLSEKYNLLRQQHNCGEFQNACKKCKDWKFNNSNVKGEEQQYVTIFKPNGKVYNV